jgi:PadR family transcriptional regulator PadR
MKNETGLNKKCLGMHKKPDRFIEACLLCLLKEEESHGYSLIEKLEHFGIDKDTINMSVVYRNLRSMESRGLIASSWTESEQGPNKRMYSITETGKEALENWILLLKQRKERIISIIEKYENMK